MTRLNPAIISDNFSVIKEKIGRLEGLVSWVHLDIMDGKFVVPTTWQAPDDLKQIAGQIKVEVHLMVDKPEEILPLWMDNVDRVTIHFEATDHLADIIESGGRSGVELGLALELETSIETVFPYVDQVSIIHLMSIAEIGYHGRPFDERVLAKIKTLREKFPNAIIQIDGGINLETGKLAIEAGANILVAGNAIWQSDDIAETISDFEKI